MLCPEPFREGRIPFWTRARSRRELALQLGGGGWVESDDILRKNRPHDTDRDFSADFDRQASATNSVSFLGLSPPKANKTVSFFVSFHRGAAQSGILFLVSIERGTSRRVYHRRPWLSDMSPPGGAPCRFLARPGCGARRCVGPTPPGVDTPPPIHTSVQVNQRLSDSCRTLGEQADKKKKPCLGTLVQVCAICTWLHSDGLRHPLLTTRPGCACGRPIPRACFPPATGPTPPR